ncbi:MAG: hypothetical protein ACYC1C_08595 [Chloroflexota bacterium]
MALINLSALADPNSADLGGLPNLLGWSVNGPNEKPVGEVEEVRLDSELGGVVSLVIRAAGDEKTFEVPVGQIRVDQENTLVLVERNLSEFEEPVPRSHDRPFLLRELLTDYGVQEETIDTLEAEGILTMERLREVVQRGGLPTLLGPEFRAEAHKVEKVIREQRM